MLCYALPRSATLRYALLRSATLCYTHSEDQRLIHVVTSCRFCTSSAAPMRQRLVTSTLTVGWTFSLPLLTENIHHFQLLGEHKHVMPSPPQETGIEMWPWHLCRELPLMSCLSLMMRSGAQLQDECSSPHEQKIHVTTQPRVRRRLRCQTQHPRRCYPSRHRSAEVLCGFGLRKHRFVSGLTFEGIHIVKHDFRDSPIPAQLQILDVGPSLLLTAWLAGNNLCIQLHNQPATSSAPKHNSNTSLTYAQWQNSQKAHRAPWPPSRQAPSPHAPDACFRRNKGNNFKDLRMHRPRR